MTALWRWVIQRRLLAERARTSLTVLGVALGVGVFVSIRLASHSALASFSDTVDAVAGKANLQITPTSDGFDEGIFPRVRAFPGVRAAAPSVQVMALAAPGGRGASDAGTRYTETVLVLGVDVLAEAPFARYRPPADVGRARALALLTDPRAVVVTGTLARRHGLGSGDTLTVLSSGRPEPLVVREVLDSEELRHAMGGNVVIVDIACAQEIFHRVGRLDRIDLLADPSRLEEIRAGLASRLPGTVAVGAPRVRTRQVENMVRAFDLNLAALSFIALFVATFLIFNAVGLSVLRWRLEIGILRALGVTRRGVATLFLGEGLLFGVAGGALGLALGTLLARGALGAVGRTLTDLYLVHHAAELRPDPATYAGGFALGVGISLASALAPAWEASRTPPGVPLRQGALIEARRLPIARWTLAGAATLGAAALVAAWTVGERRPLGGFASAFLTLTGLSLSAPGLTLWGARLAAAPARMFGGVEGALGARYLRDAIARTSVVVAALMVSVGMMVGLSIMVRSFRVTVDTWVGQTLRGDLYVEPVGHRTSLSATVLPPALVERARDIPGVVAVDTYRGTRIVYDGTLAFAAGIDFGVQRRMGGLRFVGAPAAETLARALERDGAIVTESFAHRHRVRTGDTLALAVPAGAARLPVMGVFYDYTTDAGALLVDRDLYARLWNDPRTESLALYVAEGTDVDEVRLRVIEAAGPNLILNATANRELRRRVLEVFDQTFQITYALQAIAVLVAVLGVIGTLTALILQRGRDIGVLRAIGARRGQIRKMVLVESGLVGLIGSTLGCGCGLVLATLLVHVINKQFFGWSIRMTVDPWVFPQTVALVVAAATLAGIAPARLAASRIAAEAMRAE